MRWHMFLFLLVFHVDLFAQREFNINFNNNDFVTTLTNGKINLNTTRPFAAYSGDTSKPAFPLFPYSILIPEDSTSLQYTVTYESSLVYSNVDIEKNQPVMTTNGEVIGEIKDTIVSVLSPICSDRVIDLGKFRYICLTTTPFLYDAVNRNLYFISNIKITAPSLPSTHGTSEISDWPLEYRAIAETLANPEDLSDFYTVTRDGNSGSSQPPLDYLIITSPSLASSFQNLADWKRRKGYWTEIVTTDSIYNNFSGVDTPQKIKNFLYSNRDRGIKYVLLGGDTAVVPCRICRSTSYYPDIPADIYYSCFADFNYFDWDANHDGFYGDVSDNVILVPSFILSRLPVQSAQQVTDYTNKLLQYEMATDTVATNRILLTGYNIDYYHDSAKNYNNHLYQNYIQPYWNGNRYYMYENESYLPNNTSYLFSPTNLVSEINRGYNLVHEVSHGDSLQWIYRHYFNEDYYTHSLASSQTNSLPSIIVTNACKTNNFRVEPCLSEAFIRNPNGGAVAYFGSSIDGFSTGTSFNGSFLYDGFFFKHLYEGHPHDAPFTFGGVAKEAKLTMLSYLGTCVDPYFNIDFDRILQLSINPVGDPELPIFTDKPQKFVYTNGYNVYAPLISTNNRLRKISVKSSVDSCKIVLLEDDGNIQVRENAKNVTFYSHYGQHKVTILKHNYPPYLADVVLDSINISGPILMNIREDGNNYVITALRTASDETLSYYDGENDEELTNWNLQIVNIMTSETKVNTVVPSSTYICDTSTWKDGIYVVRARDDEDTTQKKIIIKR